MDNGNTEGAWQAFQRAQRAGPQHPALAPLELTLLMAEGRTQEASARAVFWRGRLERREDTPPDLLDFLDQVAADPATGFMNSTAESDHLSRLTACIDVAAGRALPVYTLTAEPVSDAEQPPAMRLRGQMEAMGIRGADAERAIGQMNPDLPDADPNSQEPRLPHELSQIIAPPAELSEMEQRWDAACPVGKPFSTSVQPFDHDDPWAPDCAERWLALLEHEPKTMESVDVLDDLAAVLDQHPQAALPGLQERCHLPLLERAVGILDRTLEEAPADVELPWAYGENRPVLRLLYRYACWLEEGGDWEAARLRFHQLLSSTPTTTTACAACWSMPCCAAVRTVKRWHCANAIPRIGSSISLSAPCWRTIAWEKWRPRKRHYNTPTSTLTDTSSPR